MDVRSLPVVNCVNTQLVELVAQLDSVFHQSRWLFIRNQANVAVFVERKQDLPMASSAGELCELANCYCSVLSLVQQNSMSVIFLLLTSEKKQFSRVSLTVLAWDHCLSPLTDLFIVNPFEVTTSTLRWYRNVIIIFVIIFVLLLSFAIFINSFAIFINSYFVTVWPFTVDLWL